MARGKGVVDVVEGPPLPTQQDEARGLWEAIVIRLSGVVAVCNMHWVRAAEGWLYDGRTLTLLVPTRAHQDWLSSEMYAQRLSRAAAEMNRRGLRFEFLIQPQPKAEIHDGAL